jgi:hypothetical protein
MFESQMRSEGWRPIGICFETAGENIQLVLDMACAAI